MDVTYKGTVPTLGTTVDDFISATTIDSSAPQVTALRITSLIFTFLATALVVYIIIVFCYYGHHKKLVVGCGGASLSKKNRATSIVNLMVLLASFSVLVYISVELPLIVQQEKPFCAIYHRIKIISYALSLSFVYFALWYRVFTTFYNNRILKQNLSKTLRFVNVLTLVLLFMMVSSNLAVFLSAPAYDTTNEGCKAVQGTESNKVKWVVLVACTTCFQITLLFSFIYPLYMHRKKMLNQGHDNKSTIPVLKRAAIVASVCIASDLFNSAFAIVYKSDTVYLNHIVFSCNLMINLLGVILSFANWKEKTLPCCKIKEIKPNANVSDRGMTTSKLAANRQDTHSSVVTV